MAGFALTSKVAMLFSRSAFHCVKVYLRPGKPRDTAQNSAFYRYLSISPVLDMRLVQYSCESYYCCGVWRPIIQVGFMVGDFIVEINKLNPYFPQTVIDILRFGYLEEVKKLPPDLNAMVHMSDVCIESPVTGMDKVICVGLNYKDHCTQYDLKVPQVPIFFSKFPSCVIGQKNVLRLRGKAQKVDWEVELAVVIGQVASDVRAADAYYYIAGYTVAQDISARDWQKEQNGGQFLLGKAMDTFCPMGPWMTTYDEICDPHNLGIRCYINGFLKQDSNTEQMIFRIDYLIERLTSVMTLLPGDVILTGTPGGIGIYRNPQEFIRHGDTVISEIDGIGQLRIIAQNY